MAYCLILANLGGVPLDGKKAPTIILSLICMVLSVKSYRKNNPDQTLHFWEGLVVANLTNLVGAIVSAVGLYIWLSGSGNYILNTYISESIKTLQISSVKDGYIKEMGGQSFIQLINGFKNLLPENIAKDEITGLKGKLPLGVLVSIMISLYYRRGYLN
ncbi:MAG: hypothetical protein RLZZ306_787 [Bacteroidota bacterium]